MRHRIAASRRARSGRVAQSSDLAAGVDSVGRLVGAVDDGAAVGRFHGQTGSAPTGRWRVAFDRRRSVLPSDPRHLDRIGTGIDAGVRRRVAGGGGGAPRADRVRACAQSGRSRLDATRPHARIAATVFTRQRRPTGDGDHQDLDRDRRRRLGFVRPAKRDSGARPPPGCSADCKTAGEHRDVDGDQDRCRGWRCWPCWIISTSGSSTSRICG